jgi:hypothetical protein
MLNVKVDKTDPTDLYERFIEEMLSQAVMKVEHICERRVQLAKKISAIITIDRAPV